VSWPFSLITPLAVARPARVGVGFIVSAGCGVLFQSSFGAGFWSAAQRVRSVGMSPGFLLS
jgi:hypothetical protein